MSFSFNKVGKTALAYDIRKWFRQLEDPHIFMAEHLSGKIKNVDVRITIGGLGEGLLGGEWTRASLREGGLGRCVEGR